MHFKITGQALQRPVANPDNLSANHAESSQRVVSTESSIEYAWRDGAVSHAAVQNEITDWTHLDTLGDVLNHPDTLDWVGSTMLLEELTANHSRIPSISFCVIKNLITPCIETYHCTRRLRLA